MAVDSFSLQADANKINTPVISYWSGRGLCEPLRCIVAAAGFKFENNFIRNRQGYLDLIKEGKLEYDQLPLVEIDGLNMVQTTATAYYLATKYDLMPNSMEDQYIVRHVWAACQDARKVFVGFPWSRDKNLLQETVETSPKELLHRYCPKWESRLSDSGGSFVLGAKPTLADIGIFEVLDFYATIMGDEELQTKVLDVFPNIATLYKSVLRLGRLKTWTAEERPKLMTSDWEVYANCVDQTLQPSE